MTKFEQGLLQNYKRATKHTLEECYGKCSRNKQLAYDYCVSDYMKHEGRQWRICSYNTYGFTFAYLYDAENGKTHLRYHTKDNIYDFAI